MTGLAECDFFLGRYRECVETLEPSDAEAAGQGLDMLMDYFVRKAPEEPEATRIECAHAVVEQRKHEQPRCDWSGGPPVEELAARWVPPAPDTSRPGLHIVETTGEGLDGPIAGRLIRARFNELRPCLDPALAATIELTLKIGPKGTAEDSTVESAELSPDARQCLEEASRGWRFPTPSTGRATVVSTLEMVVQP